MTQGPSPGVTAAAFQDPPSPPNHRGLLIIGCSQPERMRSPRAVRGLASHTDGTRARAVTAALRARRTGCGVTLSVADPPEPGSPLRRSLDAAGIRVVPARSGAIATRELLQALQHADVVGLLPGSSALVADPRISRLLQARTAPPALVWAGQESERPPAGIGLAVIDEPHASSGPVAGHEIGYLARLTDHARSIAASGADVAMRLHSGGFLLFEPGGHTRVVPGRTADPGGSSPDLLVVATIVAAHLDADRDAVAALEAATQELAGPIRRPAAHPRAPREVLDVG